MKLNMLKIKYQVILLASISIMGFGCSSDKRNNQQENTENKSQPSEAIAEHGVGPVEQVDLSAGIDPALVEKGKAIFEAKCTACHKFDERYVGPALAGVTERRNPAWIMNMIINPQEMTQKDPVAKGLLAEYMVQMVNQNVTEDDSRALLEYFRSVDNQ